MAVVAFDFEAWSALYPELAAVGQTAAGLYFTQATLYLDNTDCSIVQDVNQRALLLYMLTAHVAWLAQQRAAGNAGLANPITGATQGSVNVTLAQPDEGTPRWYQLSSYGRDYWAATARFRTARYVAPRPTVDAVWQRRI